MVAACRVFGLLVLLLSTSCFVADTVDAGAVLVEGEDATEHGDVHAAALEALLDQLHGPPRGRDVARLVAELAVLAEAPQPSAAAASAAFHLAALQLTGVTEAVAWNASAAVDGFRRAALGGDAEARAALGAQLAYGGSCEEGLPHIHAAADEALRLAEAEGGVDREIGHEPPRLRDRLRDGRLSRSTDGLALEEAEMEAAAANAGDTEAQRQRGYRRLLGRGQPADAAAAAQDFRAAAAGGDLYAAFNLGFIEMNGLVSGAERNHSAAREHFTRALPLPAAYNGLGVLSFWGWGVAEDKAEALRLFRAGADAGDADASFNLGLSLAAGHGCEPNASAAIEAFEEASEGGHWRAPHTLAAAHADGAGTPVNCTRSARLFLLFIEERRGWGASVGAALAAYDARDAEGALLRLAPLAAQGCEAATSNAAHILRRSAAAAPPGQPRREALLRRARALWVLAAARGGSGANVDLGDEALSRGDAAAAAAHYAAASDSGEAEGAVGLALLLLRGSGVERDAAEAQRLIAKAWDEAETEEEALPPGLLLLVLHASRALRARGEAIALCSLSLALAAVVRRALSLRTIRTVGAPQPPGVQ